MLLIGLAGQAQSGKSTAFKYISDEYGLDGDHKFIVSEYSFAYPLKEFCINTLGLRYEQCFGTGADKETFTQYLWEDVHIDLRKKFGGEAIKSGHMTAREVMQVQGELQRYYFCKSTWLDYVMRKVALIPKESNTIVVISDVRHRNEVEACITAGGHIIYLSRHTNTSLADSEAEILKINWNMYKNVHILDNTLMSISQKETAIKCIMDHVLGINVEV